MRFIELVVVTAALLVAVNAAPTSADKRDVQKDQPWKKEGFVFDPKWKKENGRRERGEWKGKGHSKRSNAKECCGGEGKFGLGFGARLDIGASGSAEVAAPAPQQQAAAAQQQAAAAAPIHRNDRNGDSVVVVVDAKHSG
jgi:hypothetical protein